MIELKPCPFCGKEPTVRQEGTRRCIECCNAACAAVVKINASVNLAEKYWNTRAEEPIERIAHWDINCDGYYPFCSACGESTVRMSKFCPNCGARMTTRGADK